VKDGEKTTLILRAKYVTIFGFIFCAFPFWELGSGVGGWLVRFSGLLLGEDLVVCAGGGQVAAIEVDGVGDEAARERGWQGSLALAEAYCSVEACEGDVWMVGMIFGVFRGEAAAGHAGGYLCLEMEERAGGFDLCNKDACSRKGVQAGEF